MTAAAARIAPVGGYVAYLYGIARRRAAAEAIGACGSGIVPEAAVETTEHGGLVVFHSAVSARQFGPEPFRAALADPSWLEARVLAHDRVLRVLSSHIDVLPFRFGMVCLDPTKVVEVLVRNRGAFERSLARTAGALEWGVKIRGDEIALRAAVRDASPALQRQAAAIEAAAPGAQYFLSKKYARALEEAVQAHVGAEVERCHRGLSGVAREAVQVPVRPGPDETVPRYVAMNAAYLVHRDGAARLRRVAAGFSVPLAGSGLALEVSGPWPPYHFVSTPEEQSENGTPSR